VPLRFLTAGESHGPELVAVLEGMPAGLPLDSAFIDRQLARRQAGLGSGSRMRLEHDHAEVTAGVLAGHTTGAPLAIRIANLDHAAWLLRDVAAMTVPRPGHADLGAAVKYGYRDLRPGLERASARETAARVAVGAVCVRFLEALGVRVGSYVAAIGPVTADLDAAGGGQPEQAPAGELALCTAHTDRPADVLAARLAAAEASPVRCPDPAAATAMRSAIRAAADAGDTLGGVFHVVALGVPAGLGSHVHWDRRLTGRLLGAVASIPAVKGAEVGPAFENAGLPGTRVHDPYALRGEDLVRLGQAGGGIEGGISTGEPIVVRAAMKPPSSTRAAQGSVDLASGRPARPAYERSDVCAVPRAAVVGEAMVAYVLADALLEKVGGDSLDEIRPRLLALPRARLTDLPMDDRPWRPWAPHPASAPPEQPPVDSSGHE
jgi:chorismate synthase